MKQSWLYMMLMAISMFVLGSCDSSDMLDSLDNNDEAFSKIKGQPINFEFKGVEEYGLTRTTSPLSNTGVTVWVTADNGSSWHSYTYDTTTNLWKATNSPITWQQKTMTIYAYIRYDGVTSPSNTLTVQSDQSNKTNLLKSDFLGCREQITYTSGRVSLTMKHRVAKLVVHAQVYSSDNINSLTACATTETFATTAAITCGDMNVDLFRNVEEGDPVSIVKLYKVTSSDQDIAVQLDPLLDYSKTVTFVAYLIPLSGINTATNLTFKYGSLTGTTTVGYNLSVGITLDAGCCTCYTVYLPQAKV